MRYVAAFFALICMYLASDRACIDAVNPTDSVQHLEQMYNDLTAKYDSKLAAMENRLNAVLVTTNAGLMTIEGKLEAANTELSSVKSDLQIKSEQLTNVTRALTKIQSVVCFEATANTTELSSITANAVLSFDNVILNKGDGYDEASGIFTAPVPGNYLFWVHIFNHDKLQHLSIHIRKDNLDEVRAFAPDNMYGGVASVTALFHLDKGETVSFYNGASAPVRGHSLSSYGGVLLSAD